MHQVRAVRPPPAMASSAASHELSREERETLRAVRHHAFQRHQRNTAWMRELLQPNADGSRADQEPATEREPTPEIEALRKQLEEQQREIEVDQKRHAELLSALRAIDSEAALAACRLRVEEEVARHTVGGRKEPKVIRL